MAKYARVVSVFDAQTDLLVDTIDIRGSSWEALQSLFDPHDKDPDAIGIFDIDEGLAASLRPYVAGEFDFARFSYQLDFEQVE